MEPNSIHIEKEFVEDIEFLHCLMDLITEKMNMSEEFKLKMVIKYDG
jgi:hypothetical protein